MDVETPTALLARLTARIAAGDAVDPEEIPESLRQVPAVQRMLQLARVVGRIQQNSEAVAAGEPTPPPERLGPFRLQRRLGAGGLGEVWLGVRADGQAEQQVAIKRVRADSPGFAGRLRSERSILARLQHPNIARFIDAGLDAGGLPWFALELVAGEPVTDWCTARDADLPARLKVLIKICAAVDHAHRHLVVHRDLKPGNVMVGPDGEPKLLDFGIARLLDDPADHTCTGGMTPAYAAPEQLRGEAHLAVATDVYALGLLAFRLLAGQLPAGRRTGQVAQMLAQLDREDLARPSEQMASGMPYPAQRLRGDLDAIVAMALRAAPAQRYPSAAALADDFQRHLDGRPVRARPPSRRYRLARFLLRHRAAAAFAVLALLALLAGSTVALHQAARSQAAADRAEAEAEAARTALKRAETSAAFLQSLFREQDPFARSGNAARSPQELLAEGSARIASELEGDAEGQAGLYVALARAQFGLGLTVDARGTVDRALALPASALRAPTRMALDWIDARIALAELRPREAVQRFDRALALASAGPGEGSTEWALIQRDRAQALVGASAMDEALAAATAAHARLLATLGPRHPDAALARYQLGVVHEQRREDNAALADFQAALQMLEQAHGPEDARLVMPLAMLGDVQRRLRDHAEARITLTRAAALAERHLATGHPLRAAVLLRRGTLERDAGDHTAALAALSGAEQALGESDWSVRAQLHATRGSLLAARQQWSAAEIDLRRAMALRLERGGPRHALAWFSQAEWGQALAGLGRLQQAEQVQREARAKVRELLGPDAFQNSMLAARLGATLELRQDYANAADEYADAERVVVAQAGPASHNALQYALQRARMVARLPAQKAQARQLLADLLARLAQQPQHRAALDAHGLAELERALQSR